MKKLQTFRVALLASSPELSLDPQKTAIFAEHGRIVSRGAEARGFEYRYQITAIVQDFAGDVNSVSHAVLEWMRRELPGMLKNSELAEKAFRFEVEMLSAELVDLQIEVDVEEPVIVVADGTFDHPPAPVTFDDWNGLWAPTI